MPTLVRRTTLIVRSLERSVAFYREVLGFRVWYDDEIVLSGTGLAAGRKGDRTHLVIMQAEDPVVGMIGLLEFTDPPLPAPASRRERLGIGDVVFVMQGEDAAGVHARLLERGARVHAPPHEFRVRGADGSELQMMSLSFWDPDDYFIEYNQRQP